MKISRLEKDTNGAEWMSAAIFVVGLLIVSFIFVFANTNGVKTGIERGDMAPDFTSLAHLPGNDTSDWFSYRLYELSLTATTCFGNVFTKFVTASTENL